MENLNEIETKVLQSLIQQMEDCSGGDFGCLENADKCDLTNHEFAGYIGSLTKKGVFEYLNEDYHDKSRTTFSINSEYLTA